ncbi:hypothetical protein TIFTF001_020376 [Ficus carica]|uniref:Rubisco LSMT substrate-binding domain-containing protein n=1 Tax=Ficus carica TaxID=3494 RepID=A0AA88DDL4_FICCA|nr:hypothetical protein TIFTF001_020376 [Ficus carica]
MALTLRVWVVSNIRWSRRPLLGAISPYPSLNLKLSSLSDAKLSCVLDTECDDFLPWLERKAGTEISSVLSIGKSEHGSIRAEHRAPFASRVIRTGDCILRVPYNAQLASDNLPPEINTLIGDGIGNIAKLAIVVLLEKKSGGDSDWAPYISRLPHPWEMHNTIFWSEDELEMIRQSSLYWETINQKFLIEKEYLAIRQSNKHAIEHIPGVSETIAYKNFMHAYALVVSRAWGSMKGVSLIPFADFLNHDGTSEAFVLNDDNKQLSEVVADRNYSPGEQVLIRYGKFSNVTLLLDFGFTVRTTFMTREVRSANGKGKGIPQSLRAFGRVLSCVSPQELSDLVKEAEENDGHLARRPLRKISREIEAHKILIARIMRLVEEYEASIESLVLGSSSFACERLALRRRMAWDLLNGELRVLKSASAWLKNYCTALTMTGSNQ